MCSFVVRREGGGGEKKKQQDTLQNGETGKGKGREIKRIILFRNFYKEEENMGSPVFSFLRSS